MRKILTFVAALCCTMFLSVNSVMALTPFSDGVQIEIAGVDAGAAADPSDILNDGGSVAYDATDHTLYLNGVDIEADKASGHLAGIYINAGSLTEEVIIGLYSGNVIDATNVPAIWLKGGVAFTIGGSDNSDYLHANTQGADDVFAVLCADDELLGNPKPLRVLNISFRASNSMSGSGGVYPAIFAAFYHFDSCVLEVETFEGIDPIIVDDDSYNEVHNVMLMDNSFSPISSIKGVPYNNLFPVWVDDVQLCDGLSTNSDGFYELRSWDFSHIKNGSIAYDPATYTVHLSGDFELEATSEYSAALVIGEGSADEFTVVVDGIWGDVNIKTTGTGSYGLAIRSNTTFDINGHDVNIYSKDYDAVGGVNADLTIKNGSTDPAKTLSIESEDGRGVVITYGELTIDHCKTSIKAKTEICMTDKINLNGVAIPDPSIYKVDGGNIVDASDVLAVDGTVEFDLTAHTLYVYVKPDAAAGIVVAKDASDTPLSLPYEFDTDQEVKLTPIPATGWDFLRWSDSYTDENPRTIWLDKNYNTEVTAAFSRRIESDATYYSISSNGLIYQMMDKLRGTDVSVADLAISGSLELKRAEFVDGKLFYVLYDYMQDKISLNVVTFDGTTLGTPVELVPMQDVYNPIRGLAYSAAEEVFYAVAEKPAEGKDVLVTVALADGAITEVADIPTSIAFVRDIAVNAAGDLFALVDEAGVSALYSLDKATATESLIGTIAPVSSLSDSKLFVDPTTDELIAVVGYDNSVYLVDPLIANGEWVADLMMSTAAIFTLGAAPTPKHHIEVSVATGQDTWGSAQISECSCDGGDFDEGASLTLVATPATGFDFVEWTDGNTDATRSLIVGSSDQSFIATFQAQVTKTNISVSIKSGDELKGDVEIIECSCSAGTFDEGTTLTLRVNRASGYVFDQWDDGVEDNPRVIVVGDVDKEYVASFIDGDPWIVGLEIASGQSTWGDVALPGGEASAEYKDGAEIKIVATPALGYEFDHWSDGTNDYTDAELNVVINSDITYTAYFKEAEKVEIEVAVAAGQESWGSVKLTGDKTKDEFPIGASVTLTATANTGYKFLKWDDENKDAIRTITVTEAKKFIASFEEAPVTKTYPIFVAGFQFDEDHLTLVAGVDLPGVLKSGSIMYDPATNTLTLTGVELELTDASAIALLIENGVNVKIVIEGTCKITAAGTAISLIKSGTIAISGDGSLELKAKDGIALNQANITLDGLNLKIEATNNGIVGAGAEKLNIKGGSFNVKGAAGSVLNLGDMELNWCDFQSGYDFANNQVEKSGVLATDAVILDAWPMLTVSPVEKGTAKFILTSKKHGDEFTDKGWFEDGDQVTIEIEATDGFVFGHWTDDADWKDAKKRMKETRKFDKDDTNQTLSALMYYEAQSDADWFGINNNEFVRFSFSDNAEKVARASNTLTDARGGEFVEDSWVYVDDGAVYTFEFDGTLKDGKDIAEKIDTKYNKKSIGDVTDMAYDLVNDELLAVEGSKLFRVTSAENKEIATFKFEDVETAIVAIAFDADGVLYALGKGDGTEGVLYTVDIDGKDAKLRIVGKKDNGGKIGMKVSDGAQSLAFDPATGELFWGAADYIRVIDLGKMKTNIAGDLGQKEGAQGFIQSLHRMAIAVEVTVKVDKDQAEWGSASVGDETTTAKKTSVSAYFVEGAPVTITATANSGYHFVEWVNPNSKNDNHEEATYEFAAEDITYIAVFEKGEGIQSITIDPTKKVQKVLIDGTIYIFRDGRVYTVTGELMQ